MEAEDLTEVDVGDTFSGDLGGAGDSVDHLAEVVGEDENGVVPIGRQKFSDQVNPHYLPWGSWYVQGLDRSSRMGVSFLSSTGIASLNVLLDKSTHAGPPIMPFHSFVRAMNPRVSHSGVIVTLSEDLLFEVIVWWNVDTPFVVYQPVHFFP